MGWWLRQPRPNNSFKPTPLRGANHMAGKACHVLHAPTQRGLTLALGLDSRTAGAGHPVACCTPLIHHSWHLGRAGGGIGNHSWRTSASDRRSFGTSTIILSRLRCGWRCGFSAARAVGLGSALAGTVKARQVVVVFGSGVGPGARHRRPNDSFKPTLLRSAA